MTNYFYQHQIRIFDYPKWAEPLREALHSNMDQIHTPRIVQSLGAELPHVLSLGKKT